MQPVQLIVGLGNPARRYAATRHNVGFRVVERLAQRWAVRWEAEPRFQAQVGLYRRDAAEIWLCEPQTYMNASGEAVGALMRYFQIPLAGLLVIVDDADLPLGRVRLRPDGSSGGHHGLESVERALGTRQFARLRVGIGREAGAREITDYVLSRFDEREARQLEKILDVACDQVVCWSTAGITAAMNQFNRVVVPPETTNETTC